jgi:undecaprenyl-diphosphatase
MTRRDVLRIGGALVVAAAAVETLLLGFGELLVHVLVPGAVGRDDDAVERTLFHARTPVGNTLTSWGTQLAQPITVEVGLAVLVVVLGVLTRGLLAPAFLVVAVVGESGLYDGAVSLVRRPRPAVPRLGAGDPMGSFPSGHVAAAICLYGSLAVLAWAFGAPRAVRVTLTALAVLVPPLMALCRMYRGFHHPTDVLAGAVLGALWLAASSRLLLAPALARLRDRRPTAAGFRLPPQQSVR